MENVTGQSPVWQGLVTLKNKLSFRARVHMWRSRDNLWVLALSLALTHRAQETPGKVNGLEPSFKNGSPPGVLLDAGSAGIEKTSWRQILSHEAVWGEGLPRLPIYYL